MTLRLLEGLADLRKKTPLSILKRRNISQSSIHAGFKRFLPFKNVTRSFTRPPKNVTRLATAAQRTVIRCRSLVLCYVVWLVQNSQAQPSKTDTEVYKTTPPMPLLPTRERSSDKRRPKHGHKKAPPNNVRQGRTQKSPGHAGALEGGRWKGQPIQNPAIWPTRDGACGFAWGKLVSNHVRA